MHILRLLRKRGWRGTLLGIVCAGMAWLVSHSTALLSLEEWLQDGCFAFRGQRPTRARVLIVGLDEETLDGLKKPLLYTSPELAEVVRYFKAKGAAAIGLDVFVPDSYTALPDLQEGKPGDVTKLGQAIVDAGNVVLPEWDLSGRRLRPVLQWQLKHLTDPGPTDIGFVNLTEDGDHFLRRQQLYVRDPETGRGHPQFALALAALGRGWKFEWTDAGLLLEGDRVPLDDEQMLRINFVGPPGTFAVISLKHALAAARGEKALGEDVEPRGAIVIIGTTARSQQDYHTTPYSNTYWSGLYGAHHDLMSGAEIHANIAATLLDRAYIHAPPWPIHLLILLAVGAVLGRVYARLNLAGGLAVAVLHHFGWKFLCLGAFAFLSLRLEILPMLVLGGLLYGTTFLQRWWTLRRMVGMINSEKVIALLEDDPGALDRRGEDRVVTVLFADIRGFSTFSENHAAHEVVALLNAYFSAVVPVVERHGGMLNQYIGDGMMVIFGSPVAQDDHAARAVRAAAEMVRLVDELRERWTQLDFPGFRIGVGVHTGRAVLGMVGSPNRLDYTAIGDTTNTAARIEAKTRDLDVDILISRSTYLDVPRDERTSLGCDPQSQQVEVKGKTQKIDVHAVRARTPMTGPQPAPARGAPTLAPHEDSGRRNTEPAGEPATVTWDKNLADGQPQLIGQYRILGELGRGGMGIVHRAEDARLRRIVALKVVRRELAADPLARARFLREARAAAAVESDHIVPIYEADETPDGTLYLAMPYLQGQTLEARLRTSEKLTISQAARIGAEIAAGLAAAHARGLIHRDVKPANIWLEFRNQESGIRSQESGARNQELAFAGGGSPIRDPLPPGFRVKLLDFGLARVEGSAELSLPGAIIGTPSYMSPEQARGGELDARSDLFSLGTVLYRLVTGRMPFTGDSTIATLRAIEEHEPIRAKELRADVPDALDLLIGELLAKRPEDRPASANEVRSRLKAVRDVHSSQSDSKST